MKKILSLATILILLTSCGSDVEFFQKEIVEETEYEIYDPCGPSESGLDEIILVYPDGALIAYFEQNGHRHLTALIDGAYRTTDAQKCFFEVLDGIIINEHL